MTRLLELKIEITDSCPLRCIHCSTDATMNGGFLSYGLATRAIEEAAGMGCSSVQLSGGEPFLDGYQWKLVNLIHQLKMQCSIYTCGVGDEKIDRPFPIESLKEVRPDKLIFSLYSGERKIHEKITRRRKSFERTFESIQRSIDIGLNVELHCVIMTINMEHLDSLMELADSIGIQQVSFLRLVPQGRTNVHSEFLPYHSDYMKFRWIVKDLKNKYKTNIRLGSPFNFLNIGKHSPCRSGDRMVINSHGVAFPCDALKGIHTSEPSTILYNSLDKIMRENELFNLMRKNNSSKECIDCKMITTCESGCLAQRIYTCGIHHRDPDCLKG